MYLFIYKHTIRVIVDCIYTPTGKREDLWGNSCKETLSVKCLEAYKSISYVIYLSKVLRK